MSKRHASTEDEPQSKITNDFDDDFLPFEYEVLSGDAAASFLSDLPDQPTETPSTSEPSNSVRLVVRLAVSNGTTDGAERCRTERQKRSWRIKIC
ncbi:hypothetical protein GEMRC1_001625 [Eukaryota sp. GEM-RC1]